MTGRAMLYVAGGMLAAAIGFAPIASADEFFPPGVDQIGDRTYIADIYNEPFYRYSEWYAPYQVLDGDESLGEFTNTETYYISPYQPWGIWAMYQSDLISDSSYDGLSDGATQQNLSFWTITFPFLQTMLFSSDYINNPGIATSYEITVLNTVFPIWDITYDTASDGATGLASVELFGMDFGSFGDMFGAADVGDALDPGNLLGLDPGAFADLFELF